MDARTLRVLEFDKVLALLAAQAQTHLGRERCLALRPRPDADWVFARLRETSEARALLTALGAPPFGGVADLHETLERAGVGAVLRLGKGAARLRSGVPGSCRGSASAVAADP